MPAEQPAVITSLLMMPQDLHTKTQQSLLKVFHTKTLSWLWQWRLSSLGSLASSFCSLQECWGGSCAAGHLVLSSGDPHKLCQALTPNMEHGGMRLVQEQPWWPWAVAPGRGMVAQGGVGPARGATATGTPTARTHSTQTDITESWQELLHSVTVPTVKSEMTPTRNAAESD